jgi:hypothetical protein
MTTTIAIKNQSTALTDTQVQLVMSALQIQLDRDFYPVWRTTAKLVFLSKNQPVPQGVWPIYIMDNSDVAGALGYHDEMNIGVPFGRVFVKTAQKYGYSWTVTLSHELLEMLVNPNCDLTVFRQKDNTTGTIYSFEIGDPCEDDSCGYKINNILVSDFVYPAWFDNYQTVPGTKYDYCGKITAPFQILKGGYVSVFNVPNYNGWSSLTKGDVVVDTGKDESGRNRLDR